MIVLVRFFPASLLALNGLIYGLLSVMFVLEPLRWFANLNIELQDPVGYTELRHSVAPQNGHTDWVHRLATQSSYTEILHSNPTQSRVIA